MLGRRILTAILLVPAALAALFLLPSGGWAWVAGIVVTIGAWEWARLAGGTAVARVLYAGVVGASLLLVSRWLPAPGGASAFPVVTGVMLGGGSLFWLVVALPWLARRWHVRSGAALAITGWWVLVPAWLATVLLQPAPGRLLVLMAVVWIADTSAYFAGRTWGRRKLAPAVSPGKTWEGVGGAVVGVGLFGAVIHAWRPDLTPGRNLATGLALMYAMTALSVIGDLFESWMKREAGVKDSGTILPGHGGILDRIDGLTAALPLPALLLAAGA